MGIDKARTVETLFLCICLSSEDNLQHYTECIPPEAFADENARAVFTILRDLRTDMLEVPTLNTFAVKAFDSQYNLTDQGIEILINYATSVFYNTQEIDNKFIEKAFIDDAKKRLRRIIGSQIAGDLIATGDAQLALQEIDSMGSKEFEDSSFQKRLDSWARVLSLDGRRRIPTGFTTLDRELQGGMLPGEYSLLLGFTNSGKSFIVANFAMNAIRFGFKVAHFTNENPIQEVMNRYAVGLSETPIYRLQAKAKSLHDVMEPYKALIHVTQAEVSQRLPSFEMNKSLHIFDLRNTQSTVSAIQAHLARLERYHEFVPDVLILDDLDNMEGNHLSKFRDNEEKDLTDTSKGLNELADAKDIVIWCAAQMKGTEGFKESVSLGRGESRSRRAKSEIPDNSFYNLQTETEKAPPDNSKPTSRLEHKRARNMRLIQKQIRLTHDYEICRVYDSDMLLQENRISQALF
jgi:replicative DNA helicase